MQKSLYWKLTLAFMLVAFLTAGLVAVLIRATSANRLMSLIIDQQRDSLEQDLATYYQTNESWDGVEAKWLDLQFQNAPTPISYPDQATLEPGSFPDAPRSFDRDRRSMFGLADENGKVIIAAAHEYPQGSILPSEALSDGKNIVVDEKTVGIILTTPLRPDFNPSEALFLERTTQALALAMIGALLVAMTLGILLARTLTRPLQALTLAAQSIAQGDLNQQVKVTSKDEIGQLADAFNRMSQEVNRVNQLRRQMTADIAHDLRTPLTVIAGYIEAMRDGVLQPTEQRLSLIYAEIERLQHLVTDLRVLSQADAGELPLHPQQIAVMHLLERTAEVFCHHAEQQEVDLQVEIGKEVPDILVDEARMMQILDNLISNALRYTPAGGTILLGAKEGRNHVDITVKDTGEGIIEDELPFIFDRFHRADKSRQQESGGSGLGLSIVKALVEAHHGRVWADSTPGAGTIIHIEMPTAKEN